MTRIILGRPMIEIGALARALDFADGGIYDKNMLRLIFGYLQLEVKVGPDEKSLIADKCPKDTKDPNDDDYLPETSYFQYAVSSANKNPYDVALVVDRLLGIRKALTDDGMHLRASCLLGVVSGAAPSVQNRPVSPESMNGVTHLVFEYHPRHRRSCVGFTHPEWSGATYDSDGCVALNAVICVCPVLQSIHAAGYVAEVHNNYINRVLAPGHHPADYAYLPGGVPEAHMGSAFMSENLSATWLKSGPWEIVSGDGAATPASDVYALGCDLFCRVFDREPWHDYSLETQKKFMKYNETLARGRPVPGGEPEQISPIALYYLNDGAEKRIRYNSELECSAMFLLIDDCLRPDPARRPSVAAIEARLKKIAASLRSTEVERPILDADDPAWSARLGDLIRQAKRLSTLALA